VGRLSVVTEGSGVVDERSSVVDKAIRALVARIESGRFAPGERLPAEAVLARELDLSRLSLREAVRALASSGVLEVRRGDGTFVTDLRPDRMLRALGTYLDLVGEDGLTELFECRRVIEPGATALAASRVDEATLDRLAERLERMRTLRDPERLVAEDLAFHADIVGATGNATLASLADSVAQRTARARIWRALVTLDVVQWTHEQHMSIYRALRARDGLAAWTAATVHVTEVEQWVRDRIGGGPPEPTQDPVDGRPAQEGSMRG
jgi:GntR family transcriptional regulator, transcriptional repressor for pyruvate dehydrogenase complex